ncbi:MAG: IS30 family transposase [Oscillospiraceae bacterium]
MALRWSPEQISGRAKRGKIPNTTPISERPAGAENRTRFGHWESDTVLGMRKTGCFGTHVERKSGFLVDFRIDDRQVNAFNKATIQAFSAIPDKLKKSFTVDNGKEFAAHQKLAEATGMKVYYCRYYKQSSEKRLNFLTPFEVLKKFFS